MEYKSKISRVCHASAQVYAERGCRSSREYCTVQNIALRHHSVVYILKVA